VHPILAELTALFVPPQCSTCGRPLTAAADLLCGDCRRTLPWLRGRRCERCALPTPCAPCPARSAAFERSWAPVAHSGPARAAVQALKFRGALPLAELMAAQIAASAPPALFEADAVVPVPPARERARRRGFDPAALIACELAGRAGLPLAPCLRRVGPAPRQLGAAARDRRRAGRIGVRAVRPPPARVLLVDDVHTTGATLDACARELRMNGAAWVAAATYSRTL
jgi:predicted amidophosphoribosyltransferase